MDIHDLGITDGGWVGHVGTVRTKATRIIAVLCLLPSAGVACGSAAAFTFAPIDGIELIDGGPNCPELRVGSAVLFSDCFDKPGPPQFVHEDRPRGLVLMTTSRDYAVRLVDQGFRVVSQSDHYVVVQRSHEVGTQELRFTFMSADEVDWCHITAQHVISCHRLVFNA